MSSRNGSKVVLPPIPAKRYFTIGEVSELCGVKPHVLRYWEQEFTQLRPMKRRGNRRYYQHHEVLLVRRIRELLYEEGFTINGARNRLSEPGGRARMGTMPEAEDHLPVDEIDAADAGGSDPTVGGQPTAPGRTSRSPARAQPGSEVSRLASTRAQPSTAEPSSTRGSSSTPGSSFIPGQSPLRGRGSGSRAAISGRAVQPALAPVAAPQGDLFAEHDMAALQWVRSELTHALWLLSQD
jgi:DNA-binding transcriptional MerR regulator